MFTRNVRIAVAVVVFSTLCFLSSKGSAMPLASEEDNLFRIAEDPSWSQSKFKFRLWGRDKRRTLPFQLMNQPRQRVADSDNFVDDFRYGMQPKVTRAELIELLDTLADQMPIGHRNRVRFGLL